MKLGFPSEKEQEFVRKYVMERPLYRPSITYLKAFLLVFIVMLCVFLLSLIGMVLLHSLGFSLNKKFYFLNFFCVILIVLARWFAILCIRLYQHYAPEEVRRRCLLKPTCSEYAIIVIKKYGFLIGGIKTWLRLNYKCRGNVYYIDEP